MFLNETSRAQATLELRPWWLQSKTNGEKSDGSYRVFGVVLVFAGDGCAERVQIFYSYYGRQEVGFTGRAVVSAWIHCPGEVFTEGSYAVELALSDLASKRTETALIGRSERI